MPKPEGLPKYRVVAWWDGETDDPSYRIGFKRMHGMDSKYITLPFSTSNDVVYKAALKFAVYITLSENFMFTMEFNRNYLYNDMSRAKREHYFQTRLMSVPQTPDDYSVTATAFDYDAWQARQAREKAAKEKARQLLTEVTDATFAANVEAAKPFYFSPERGRTYIIDPWMKNVVWLKDEHPVGLCIYLEDTSVQQNTADWAVAIYLYLKGANSHLHKVANEYRYLRGAEWRTENVTIPKVEPS